MKRSFLVLGVLLALYGIGYGELSISMDDEFRFVLNGEGEQLLGVDFRSASGSLKPAQQGIDGKSLSHPFSIALSNTPSQIVFGNLGNAVTVSGPITLSAGWDAAKGIRDVEAVWGDGPAPREAVVYYGPLRPALGVSVNEDRKLVVTGQGHLISELSLLSKSGALVPATTVAPFINAATNSNHEVKLVSPGGLQIDGDVTLGVGWSDHLYTQDIHYQYQLLDPELLVGPRTIPADNYQPQLPVFEPLDARVNDDLQVVVSGAGHPVSELSLRSASGSLVPGNTPSPFQSFSPNLPSHIRYHPAGGVLTVDGDLVLDTQWLPRGEKDLRLSYELVGDLDGQLVSLGPQAYPAVPDYLRQGVDPLLITLDDQNRFVITGTGQQIRGIEFRSEAGALVPSQNSTDPFPFLLSNTENKITIGILGTPAEISGSFIMDFGLTSADALEDIAISVGYGEREILLAPNVVCTDCDLPTVSLLDNRDLVLENFPDRITEIRFASTAVSVDSLVLPPGVTATTLSEHEVLLSSEAGFGPELLKGLSATWELSSDHAVFVSFTLLDGTGFGPLPLSLASSPVVPEPQSTLLVILAMGVFWNLRGRRRP